MKSNNKIILINPPTTDPQETSLYFPMALLTLGGVIKKTGFEAELWDFDLFFKRSGNCSENHFKKLLKHGVLGANTPIFAISSICSNFPMALWMAQQIKEILPESLIVLGGPQPSSLPKEILEHFPCVDLVVCGEGEIPLEQLIKYDFSREAFKEIPGLAYRQDRVNSKDGVIQMNDRPALIENLDDIPFPDYSLINFQDYIREKPGQFFVNVEVGRGCPFKCTFCSTSIMWARKFRVKSPKRIFDEMMWLYRHYGFTAFDFIHDNFTTSRKFVLDFCHYMIENNHKNFKWFSSSRTDCIDNARVDLMQEAGLVGLFFGLESGSERMQKVIQKNLDFAHFENLLTHVNNKKLRNTTAFILGFPEETLDDMNATIRKAMHYKSLGTQRVFLSKLSALAGTGIHQKNKDQLKELSYCSTLSPQKYALEEINQLIEQYPDLFSSFYHVPHPECSLEYLTKFIEFSHLLVNGDAKWILNFMDENHLEASEIFHYWEPWSEQKGIYYQHYRQLAMKQFHSIFEEFLNFVEKSIAADGVTHETPIKQAL
ncbi:MAG: radical SAM protein [Deltaproteobacteria bacterium]|nr:radical SAM protein [Deltaproteobacteria bacterium]